MQSAAAIIFPIMVTLIVMAEPFIRIFLNEKWLPAVPYIRILCVTGMLFPIYMLGSNILAIKDINLHLKIECVSALTLFAALFSLAPFGIEVFLIGQTLHTALAVVAADFYTARHIGCPFLSIFARLAKVTAAAAAMGGALYLATAPLGSDIGILPCVLLPAAAFAAYCLCLRALKVEAFTIMIRYLSRKN
jgi:O-antigen/teichoic acid export membrane protein